MITLYFNHLSGIHIYELADKIAIKSIPVPDFNIGLKAELTIMVEQKEFTKKLIEIFQKNIGINKLELFLIYGEKGGSSSFHWSIEYFINDGASKLRVGLDTNIDLLSSKIFIRDFCMLQTENHAENKFYTDSGVFIVDNSVLKSSGHFHTLMSAISIYEDFGLKQ